MPSLLQISSVHHVLEIAGPRGQVWRPAHSTMGGMFREAQALADQVNLAGVKGQNGELWEFPGNSGPSLSLRPTQKETPVTSAIILRVSRIPTMKALASLVGARW